MVTSKLLQTVKLMDSKSDIVGYIYTCEGDVSSITPNWKYTWLQLLDNKSYWTIGGVFDLCGLLPPVNQIPSIATLSNNLVVKSYLSNGYTIALV